ncbi:cytochrome P450 [Aspergillus japonicus CBS 114.51]|uniref:Cytochrome P450 n=1 Tax=Aspergillus japonicus CBS 114.51 TaxID=1448312 RepID=A0A8T8X2P6_ASPJA|nr:cytochrome P450 [Aspergillus japonicus CBS 114.51]RAH82408.1 cytochrome P450 [Aspergillus japonicus CBS 114.51]
MTEVLLNLPLLLKGTLAVIVVLLLLVFTNRLTTWEYIVPKEVQWIDRPPERFGYLRAKARSFFVMKQNVMQAYLECNKKGRAAALAIAFGRPQIILPPKYIRWIIDQPESVLSMDPIHDEFHAFVQDGLVGDHSVQEVLRKELTHNLGRLTADINDEIVDALQAVWGDSPEWRTIPLKDSTRTIIARITNRLFVGKELCRNEQYIRDAVGLGLAVMPETVFQDLLPRPLKGPVSKLVKWINRFYMAGFNRHLLPVVQQRIRDVKRMEEQPEAASSADELPSEFLTWIVQRAIRRGEPMAEMEQRVIARVGMANLASIETTTNTMSKCLADLTTLGEAQGYRRLVTAEARTVLRECQQRPEKKDIDKLGCIENALKESLRLAVVFPGLIRQVTSPTGATLAADKETGGLRLPHGARISVAAYAIHRDDSLWPEATTYNPARYEVEHAAAPRVPMSRASERFLSFGMGKRACPGRFFVTDELKLLFAHIFTKYEIKVIPPPPTTAGLFTELTLRGPQEQLMIRRRTEEEMETA